MGYRCGEGQPRCEVSMIRVVSAAVVVADSAGRKRMLLTQRAPTASYPFKWVTPGGKVEPGETDADALYREMREECGQAAIVWLGDDEPIYVHEMKSSRTDSVVAVRCYLVRTSPLARFYPMDGTIGVGWFDADTIAGVDLGPADDANRGKLADVLR